MSAEVMSGGGGSPKLQTKTVSPSTSSQNITPDSNYDGLSKVTVNAMPTGSLNGISVNSNGLITSSVGTSGYLPSGINKTLQLPTQGSTYIAPTSYSQIAVSNGKYTTGNIYVNGDNNLIPGNIRNGVSIFGVSGSYSSDLTWECGNYDYTDSNGRLIITLNYPMKSLHYLKCQMSTYYYKASETDFVEVEIGPFDSVNGVGLTQFGSSQNLLLSGVFYNGEVVLFSQQSEHMTFTLSSDMKTLTITPTNYTFYPSYAYHIDMLVYRKYE